MGRKKSVKTIKSSTPLKKVDDALDPALIVKDDRKLVQVHFVADLMVRNKSNEEIRQAYNERYGEEISLSEVTKLKRLVRVIYTAEISKDRDEMVAEELMHAQWELKELQDYWERSKNPKKKVTRHKADSDGTEMTTYNLFETTESEEDQIGDLEAMKRIGAVRERIINLLGLNAPKKVIPAEEEGTKNAITINIVGQRRGPIAQDVEIVQ